MDYSFSKNYYDVDGDLVEECILAHIGDNTIIQFADVDELEEFAKKILGSIKEIRETN